ncbi:helix-turn-helix domain-containing protein [bacterium]|nr:helix-turn-helix domain-containing protein [bacterium]MBU4361981.1 helix-turn-helix domain-containing protein [bacterium]MCG2761783.1 helix-turn-helix domain-containing protein [Candidatus Atribacteria bacterium]
MKDIGNFLKERREARGISLIEVEKDLKIRKKYLQALEEGNVEAIPGKTYLIGYLRNYSKYLGINEENINQIIQTYHNLEKKKSGLKKTKEENIYLKTKDRSIFEKKRFFFPIKYVYLTSFVLIIFVGLLLLSRSLKEAQNFPLPSPIIGNETGTNIENKANDISALTEELIKSKAEAINTEYSTQDSVLAKKLPILKLIASDKTWVKILSEDKTIFEGILFEDEEFFWETDQALKIITEYPTKIETYYNNEIIDINKGIIDNYLLKYNFNPTQNI